MKEKIILSQMDVQKYGFASPYLENHDQPRSVSKYIPAKDRGYESATALGTMFFFLRGVPFIFQGQELGMENCPFRSIEDYRDPVALQRYEMAAEQGEYPFIHFAPSYGWMNDPVGLFQAGGKYHISFQHNLRRLKRDNITVYNR